MHASPVPRTQISEEDIALARTSAPPLSAALTAQAAGQWVDIHRETGGVCTVRIPTVALRLLLEVLNEIAQGNAVSVIPIHAELTTQEAADVLGVSRPRLVQLLEKGEMRFHKIGTHRRVRYQDVIDYKKRIDAERRKASDD